MPHLELFCVDCRFWGGRGGATNQAGEAPCFAKPPRVIGIGQGSNILGAKQPAQVQVRPLVKAEDQACRYFASP